MTSNCEIGYGIKIPSGNIYKKLDRCEIKCPDGTSLLYHGELYEADIVLVVKESTLRLYDWQELLEFNGVGEVKDNWNDLLEQACKEVNMDFENPKWYMGVFCG